jgi:catechol 1,2-dioxygenase
MDTTDKKNGFDRRKFLRAGSMLGIGSLFLPKDLLASFAQPEADAAALVAGGDCILTSDDILGPFYLAGSPVTTQVATPDESGTRLFISGTVYSNDCMTPVEGAKIEVWQANAAAQYDTSQNFELRATMYSDANGHYAYETIMPGAYLNGNQYRPKHIHYRVSGPGFPELITQLYFDGDPYIPADPWASQADAAMRIIPLNEIGTDQLEGVFDIVLDGFVGIKPNRFGKEGDLLPPHPNPASEMCSIHFNVFRQGRVQLTITDMRGREVITLLDEDRSQGRYTTQWNGNDASGIRVSSGNYLAVLLIDGKVVRSRQIGRL